MLATKYMIETSGRDGPIISSHPKRDSCKDLNLAVFCLGRVAGFDVTSSFSKTKNHKSF